MFYDPDLQHRILEGLNPAQSAAVLSEARTLLILAGAGSGKTRTLTCRIAHGVVTGQIRPDQIMAVTFSNRAAGELKERIRGFLDEDLYAPMLGITFHAAGLSILRQAIRAKHPAIALEDNFSIYDDDEQDSVVKRVLERMGMPFERSDIKRYRRTISQAKGRGLSHDEVAGAGFARRLERFNQVYAGYQLGLQQCNAVDFGDLLLMPMRLLRDDPAWRLSLQQRYPWIVVDEFQDTNDVQMALIRLLFGEHSSLAVVGDDDQSIYRWRGAQVANILEFAQLFPGTEVIALEQNYRSTGNILAAANAVIARNERRHPKELWTESPEGAGIAVVEAEDDRREARRVAQLAKQYMAQTPESDVWGAQAPVAIFYRTHAQSLLLEESMRLVRLPFHIYGGVRFYERKEVKDVLGYVRLLINEADDGAFLRVVNVPTRGIGKGTVEKVMERAVADGATLLETACRIVEEGEGRAAKALRNFLVVMEDLKGAVIGQPAGRALEEVVERSGLKRSLEKDLSDENLARIENLGALVNAGYDFAREERDPTLQAFMERLVLHAQVDDLDRSTPHVALMTLHNAKGLEFQHVLMVGVEDGLIPHANSRAHEEYEEERRLLYVGMTRARETLTLCYARRRQRYGTYNYCDVSPFLVDLPKETLVMDGASSLTLPGLSPSIGRSSGSSQGRSHGDESYVSYEEDGFAPGNVVGMRVHHNKYGRGRVQKVMGSPGPNAVVLVRFDEGQPRKILARYLEPR